MVTYLWTHRIRAASRATKTMFWLSLYEIMLLTDKTKITTNGYLALKVNKIRAAFRSVSNQGYRETMTRSIHLPSVEPFVKGSVIS